MPGCDHPNEVAKLIFAVLDDKGDETSTREADHPILFGIIVSLIFDVRQLEEFIKLGNIDLPLG